MKKEEKKEVNSKEFHDQRYCVLRQDEFGNVRALLLSEDDDIHLPLLNLIDLTKHNPNRKYWIHDNVLNVNLTLFER